MQKIAVIVLNWNQSILTINSVESILSSKPDNSDLKVIIVDNHSSKSDYLTVKRKYSKSKHVQTYRLAENRGYSGGNNYGIKKALNLNPDYICISNNDIRINSQTISALLNTLVSNSNLGAIAPKIYFEKGHEFFKSKYLPNELGKVIWAMGGKIDQDNVYGSNLHIDEVDNGQFESPILNPDFLTGCFIMLKAAVVRKVGKFNDSYYLYLEDMDLCQRIKRAGYQLIVEPKALLWHINSGSSSPKSDLHDYFLTRNRLIYGLFYSPLKTKFALFRESLQILYKSQSYWQKRGILDFYLHRWGRGSWK